MQQNDNFIERAEKHPEFKYNSFGALLDIILNDKETIASLQEKILFVKHSEQMKQLKLNLDYLLAANRFQYAQGVDIEKLQRAYVIKALTWLYDKSVVDFSDNPQYNQENKRPFHYIIFKKIINIGLNVFRWSVFKIEALIGAQWPVNDWFQYIEGYILHIVYKDKLPKYKTKIDNAYKKEQIVPKKNKFKEYDAEQRRSLLLNYKRFNLYIDSLQTHVQNLVEGRDFENNKMTSFYKFWNKAHQAYVYENHYNIYRYQKRRLRWIHDAKLHKWAKAKQFVKFIWQSLIKLPKQILEWLTMCIWYFRHLNFWFSYSRYTAFKQVHGLYFYKSSFFVWTHLQNIQNHIKPTQYLKDIMQESMDDLLKCYWPYLHLYNIEMLETLILERLEFIKTRREALIMWNWNRN